MISMIAAVGQNFELGKKGDLCWKIKEDLQRFKKLTTNHTVVMGYNTFKSLGFKPLPSRRNIVISREPLDYEGIEVILEEDLNSFILECVGAFKDNCEPEEIFVIGGGAIYRQFLPYARKIYLTEIRKIDPDADTFFPKKNTWPGVWDKHVEEALIEYDFVIYTRLSEKTSKKIGTLYDELFEEIKKNSEEYPIVAYVLETNLASREVNISLKFRKGELEDEIF